MMRIEKTVFISYRRKDIAWATLVYKYLTEQKYDVFFDFLSISSGDFEQSIISNIRARAHFVLILTPIALDRCDQPGDWLRREIETAMDEKRNIIPLLLDGFNFGSPSVATKLTGKLHVLPRYNGLSIPAEYIEAGMDRLRNQFLNVPLDAVLHPLNAEVKKLVVEQKLAVNEELKKVSSEEQSPKEYEKLLREAEVQARRRLSVEEKIRKEKEAHEQAQRDENKRLERGRREQEARQKAERERRSQTQALTRLGVMMLLGGVVIVGMFGVYRLLSGLFNSPGGATGNDRLESIKDRGYVLVSTDPNYEPQSFLNTAGSRPSGTKCPADALTTAEMQGFDVDVAKAIGENLGVETCFVTPSWDAVIAGSWVDKWDMNVGSMHITIARQQILDFSAPYYYIPAVVAVRADSGITNLGGLEGQAICAASGSEYEAWLNNTDTGLPESSINIRTPQVVVVPLDTDQECALAIEAGRDDFVGYVTSETAVDANIAAGLPLRKLSPPVFATELALAFDKASSLSNSGLIAEVNRIVSDMHSNGQLSELSMSWFGLDLTKFSK